MPLPEVTLTGIGAGGGASIGEAVSKVLNALSTGALGAVSGGQAQKAVGGATKALKGLFGR